MIYKITGYALLVLLLATGCRKQEASCNTVTITNSAPGCGGWGIVTGGTKYPSRNIPDQFKQDGVVVCSDFTLYTDPAMCVCCGGVWADVKTMQYKK